jgi:TPP-dependent 2-oxoacid decarboxylase
MTEKAMVLDTALLVLLVVGWTDRSYISKHKNLHPIYNADHFDALVKLALGAPKIVCTAHILTETSNLLRQIADPIRSHIMTVFHRLIQTAEEVQVESKVAAEKPHFIRLGLTDAAIASLDPKKVCIFTVDHDLHIETSRTGFEVVNLTSYFHD